MGCNQSKPGLLSDVDGDGKDFLSIFMMDRILGQGEFGVVKMCYAKESSDSSSRTSKSSSKHKKSHHFLNDEKAHACKILRKGIQFKDNTIYSPIKAHVLQNECGILRTLGGRHHTLKLVGLYESPSTIYIVTDYLHGGDMFEYLSTVYGATIVYDGQEKDTGGGGGLRTEDVSRMSYELLDACNHCFKHGIMHRDIKPENIMFESKAKGASLKLIDFGAGTFCDRYESTQSSSSSLPKTPPTDASPDTLQPTSFLSQISTTKPKPNTKILNAQGLDLHLHTTFAGSGFYISPEMFRNHYTVMTDVWSVGVTLYVLVAGYPADVLQSAFNKLQSNKRSSMQELKKFPHMPRNMPDTYYEMLHECLVYKHRLRKSAGDILDKCEFVKFHKEHDKQAKKDDTDETIWKFNNRRTESVLISGGVSRHTAMLKYGQFERSLTSFLATVLVKFELKILLDRIDGLIESSTENEKRPEIDEDEAVVEMTLNRKRLQIITIYELYTILKELKHDDLLPAIEELSHGFNYSSFAYHIAFLRQFYTLVEDDYNEGKGPAMSDIDNSQNRKWKMVMGKRTDGAQLEAERKEVKNANSIHNGNAWDAISKKLRGNNEGPQRRLSY